MDEHQKLEEETDAFELAIGTGDFIRAAELAPGIDLADLRDQLERLTPIQTELLFDAIGDERMAHLIHPLNSVEIADLLRHLPDAKSADVLDKFPPDDAADVIAAIETEDSAQARRLLIEMDKAGDVRALLVHLPNTAGGRMTTEFVSVRPYSTASEALQTLTSAAPRIEFPSFLYVTDDGNELLGWLPLERLVFSAPDVRVGQLMREAPACVQGTDDQEDVARVFQAARMLAIPVVDYENRLIGVITADDIAHVVEEETTEDIDKLGGSEPLGEPYMHASAPSLVKKRVRWLLVLFLAEAYTGTVLRHFQDTLEHFVALSFFIPLLIGTGGNTGTQITTTITRALAVGDVRPRDIFRVLRKEITVALILGSIMAFAALVRSWILGVPPRVGFVVAGTAAAIVLWAAIVAAALPLALRRLRLDPAVVSGPFITTIVDGTGLIIYFTLANWLLT